MSMQMFKYELSFSILLDEYILNSNLIDYEKVIEYIKKHNDDMLRYIRTKLHIRDYCIWTRVEDKCDAAGTIVITTEERFSKIELQGLYNAIDEFFAEDSGIDSYVYNTIIRNNIGSEIDLQGYLIDTLMHNDIVSLDSASGIRLIDSW